MTEGKGTREAYRFGFNCGKDGRAPSCYPMYYGPGATATKEQKAAFVRGYVAGMKSAKEA